MGDETGVALDAASGRVRLKWHRLRRSAQEPPFAIANLRVGLALGASMEVDIRRLADDDWVCLHDDVLDRETDGAGPVSAVDAAAIRRLRIAGADFAPPLLSELAAALAAAPTATGSLQLDLKEPAETLSERAVANFAEIVGPVARQCLLTGYDWSAVQRLGAGVGGLRLGYDPLEAAEGRRLDTAERFSAFVDEVLATAPTAAAFYLYHRFATAALARGVDPVRRLQANGAMIDIWTLDPTTSEIDTILPAMVAAGADQITTNDPIGLAALWRRLEASP